jgi:hypothetical protein
VLEQAHDLVSLGYVWEFPHTQATVFVAEIERHFRNGQVPTFGRRPGKLDRELITFPLDYEIDWLGRRSSREADYCEPRASRRVDLSAPWRKEYDRDVFEDLAIPRAQWNKIARKLCLPEAFPTQSGVMGRAGSAADEPRGNAMSTCSDIWLTTVQAVYFLLTGDNLVEVSDLSEEVVISRLGRVRSASVPLSADAGPDDLAAAREELKKQLAAAGGSPSATAYKWRDDLLSAGLVTAEGRRMPSSSYETIRPIQFCGLKLAAPHAQNTRGEIVFYEVRISGLGLWQARQQAIGSSDVGPSIDHAQACSDRQPVQPPPSRFDNPVWDLGNVIGWVLDRDPEKLGRIRTVEKARSAVFIAQQYARDPQAERDPKALTTILHALQRGRLFAHEGDRALPREYWGPQSECTLRNAITRELWFWREEVLTTWPVLPTGTEAVSPRVSECRFSHDRVPNWKIWKRIPDLKTYEAVALSLNIDPNKLRHSPDSWLAGKPLFEEGEEFRERLFVVERNLEKLRVVNFANVQYLNEDPVVGLRGFAVWAVSLGWSLPCELVDATTDANGASLPVEARELEAALSEHLRGDAEPTLKSANQRRGGRKKGSGAIDDTQWLRAMLNLLVAGQAPSVHDAARKVAKTMAGTSQSLKADITRLRGKFAKAHGTEPPARKTWRDVAAELNGN